MSHSQVKDLIFPTNYHQLASQQGWNLFWATGMSAGAGEWRIQKEDSMNTFFDDYDAWEFLYTQAQKNDFLAISALAVIAAESPRELKRIKQYLQIAKGESNIPERVDN